MEDRSLQQIFKKLNNNGASSSMADWSNLPDIALELISQKLNSEFYLLRFRSVCSSWRRHSLQNCHHRHLPLKLPDFPGQIISKFSKHKSIFKKNIFLIKPPESRRPWLIKIGLNEYGKTKIWHPFDVKLTCPFFTNQLIDFLKLHVIHLGHMFYIKYRFLHHGKVVASTCEVGQPLSVVTTYFHAPYIFQCEENCWTSIPTLPKETSCGDICIFKGRPCVADKQGRTFMIGENSNVCLLANPVCGGNVKFLVESECDQLLLVDCHGIDIRDAAVRFHVFRLDQKEKNWVKLTTLGDRVLFLHKKCSFSASASDLHVANGNCIIYLSCSDFSNLDTLKSRMRIFHLDEGRVSRLSRYPNYSKLLWPPPKWIQGLHKHGHDDEGEDDNDDD